MKWTTCFLLLMVYHSKLFALDILGKIDELLSYQAANHKTLKSKHGLINRLIECEFVS